MGGRLSFKDSVCSGSCIHRDARLSGTESHCSGIDRVNIMKSISLYTNNGSWLTKLHPFSKIFYLVAAIAVPLISGHLTVFLGVILLSILERYERPLVCTEWLLRITGQNVQDIFPLFFSRRIACYNWGFVAGKYQTYEPWNMLWEQYDRGEGDGLDFTKWQHDLLRPNLRPYDPKETALIKRLCDAADRMDKEKKL